MNSMFKVVPSHIKNKTKINLSQLPSWENEVKIFIRKAKLSYVLKFMYRIMLIQHADSSGRIVQFRKNSIICYSEVVSISYIASFNLEINFKRTGM